MNIGGVSAGSANALEMAQYKAMAAQGMAAVLDQCKTLQQWCMTPVLRPSIISSTFTIRSSLANMTAEWMQQSGRQLDTYV